MQTVPPPSSSQSPISPPKTPSSPRTQTGAPPSEEISFIATIAEKFFLSKGFELYRHLLTGQQIRITSTHPVGIRIAQLYTSNLFFRALSSDENKEILNEIEKAFPNLKDDHFNTFLTKLEMIIKSKLFIPLNTLDKTDEMEKIFSNYSEIDKKHLVQEWEKSWEKLSSDPVLSNIFDDDLKEFCKKSLPSHFLNDILKHLTLFNLKKILVHYDDITIKIKYFIFTRLENPLFSTNYKPMDFNNNLIKVRDMIIIKINQYSEVLFSSTIDKLTLTKEDKNYLESIRKQLQDILIDTKDPTKNPSEKIQSAIILAQIKTKYSYKEFKNLYKESSCVDNPLGLDHVEIINNTLDNLSHYLKIVFSEKAIEILLTSVPISFVDFLLNPFEDIARDFDNPNDLKLSKSILNIIFQLMHILHNYYDEPQLNTEQKVNPQIQHLLKKLKPNSASKNDLELIITDLQKFLIDKLNQVDQLIDCLKSNFLNSFFPFLQLLLQKELPSSTELKQITITAVQWSYLEKDKENPHTWALLQSPYPNPIENNPLSLQDQLKIRVNITFFTWFIDVYLQDKSILRELAQKCSLDGFQKEIQVQLNNHLKIKKEILKISEDSKLEALKDVKALVEKIPFTSLDALAYCLEFIKILKELELITNQKPELKDLQKLELHKINITSYSLEELKQYSKPIKDEFSRISAEELEKLLSEESAPQKPNPHNKPRKQKQVTKTQCSNPVIDETKVKSLHLLYQKLQKLFEDTGEYLSQKFKKDIENILTEINPGKLSSTELSLEYFHNLSQDVEHAKNFGNYLEKTETVLSTCSQCINNVFQEKYNTVINQYFRNSEQKISETNLKKIKKLLAPFYLPYTSFKETDSTSQFSEFKTHFDTQLNLITQVCNKILVIFKNNPDFFNTNFSLFSDTDTTPSLKKVLQKLDSMIQDLPSEQAPLDPPPPSPSEENIKFCIKKLQSLKKKLQINADQFSNLTQVIKTTLSTSTNEDYHVFIKTYVDKIDLADKEIMLIKRLMKIPCPHDSRDQKWAELTTLIASSDSYDTFMSNLSKVSDSFKEFVILILEPHVPEKDLTDELLTTLKSYLLNSDPRLHTILFNYTSILYQVTDSFQLHDDYLIILMKIFAPELAELANPYPELLARPPKFNKIEELSAEDKARILNSFCEFFDSLLTMDDYAKLAKINDYINKKRPELVCLEETIYKPFVDLNGVNTLLSFLQKNFQLNVKLSSHLKNGCDVYIYGSALTKKFEDIEDVDILIIHKDLSKFKSEKLDLIIDDTSKEIDIHHAPYTYFFEGLGRSHGNSILLKFGLDKDDTFIEQGYYSAHADLLKKHPEKICFNSFTYHSQDKTLRLYELLKRFHQIIEKNKDSLSSLEKTKEFFKTKLIFDNTTLPKEFILIKNFIIEQFLKIDSNFIHTKQHILDSLILFDRKISELKDKNVLNLFFDRFKKHQELATLSCNVKKELQSKNPDKHQFFREQIEGYLNKSILIPDKLFKTIYHNLKAYLKDEEESKKKLF
jgi:hypothetical protein